VTDEHLAEHVAVNFAALLTLMRQLVPPMAARGWGRVIALGSVLASRPRAETVAYAALKSAQLTAIRAIGRDVAGRGVTMNVISPGAIETERNAGNYADAGFLRAVVAKIPAGRQGHPSDCVAPVLMLASDAAGYITGADIPVDGGWSIGDAPAAGTN
jgi:gluconate 5-dehydrogenase